jgi:hypothetical protein
VTNALGSLCEGEHLRDIVVAESRRRPTGAAASRTLDERAHHAAAGLLVELEQHVAHDLAQFVGGYCAECRVDVVENPRQGGVVSSARRAISDSAFAIAWHADRFGQHRCPIASARFARHCRANLGFAQQHHGLSRYAFSITVAMFGPFQYGSIQRRRCSVQFFAGRRQ